MRLPLRPAFVCLLLSGCALPALVPTGGREPVALEVVVAGMRAADVVYLGEVHDFPSHHRLQAEVLRKLQPAAVALEMFATDADPVLRRWGEGSLPEGDFRELFRRQWRMPWPLYEEIFAVARADRIPILGLNAPLSVVRTVAAQGCEGLTEGDLRAFPAGVVCGAAGEVPAAFPRHGMSDEQVRRLYEAQVLRDRWMAAAVAGYLRRESGRPLVVIAGGGHVMRNTAIPAEVEKLVPGVRSVAIVPRLWRIRPEEADYLMVEPLVERLIR